MQDSLTKVSEFYFFTLNTANFKKLASFPVLVEEYKNTSYDEDKANYP